MKGTRLRLTPSIIGLATTLLLCTLGLIAINTNGVNAIKSFVPIDDTPYPLFGMILDFARKADYTCTVPLGYLTGVYTRSLASPIMPTFDLPFPDSGDFVDGVVTLDTQNEIIFTYITSMEKSFSGGWLVGMKLYMEAYQGQYYTDGGLIFVTPLPADTALYGIDFDPSTNSVIGWTVIAHGERYDGKLLRINYRNGTVDTLYAIDNVIPSTSSFVNEGVHYSLIYNYDRGSISGATLYGINTQTGNLEFEMNVPLDSQLLYTNRWIYNAAVSTLFTTVYNETESGYAIATLDIANNFTLTAVGGIVVDKSEGNGLFAINTRTDLAYIISESDGEGGVNSWLLVVNSTTGHLIERRNTTSNIAMFVTYVPWIDFEA